MLRKLLQMHDFVPYCTNATISRNDQTRSEIPAAIAGVILRVLRIRAKLATAANIVTTTSSAAAQRMFPGVRQQRSQRVSQPRARQRDHEAEVTGNHHCQD